MRAELANLNNCAVSFLSRAASCAGTTILLTKTTAAQNEVALSYHSVRGLYFLAVVFVRTVCHILLYLTCSYKLNIYNAQTFTFYVEMPKKILTLRLVLFEI